MTLITYAVGILSFNIFKVLLYLSINLFLYNIYSNDNWRLFLKKTLFIKKYFQGVKLCENLI
mgnify:CR=1 FL=1